MGAPEVCPSRSELKEVAGPWVAAWPGLDLTDGSWMKGISLMPNSLETGVDARFLHGNTEAQASGKTS